MGSRISTTRERLGWTQAELAEKIGVKRQKVADIEKGRQKVPHDFLTKFVEITQVDLEYLVFGITANSTESDDYVIDVTERAAQAFQEKDIGKLKLIITELTKKYAAEKKISKERADYIEDVKTTLRKQFNI